MFSESLATVINEPGVHNRSDLRQKTWGETCMLLFSQNKKKPSFSIFHALAFYV